MKRFFCIIVLLAALNICAAPRLMAEEAPAVQSSAEHWKSGNNAYLNGDYKTAIEHYNAIIDGGEYSAKLYYNLGNAYYRAGQIGRAILYYHKTLKLEPDNEDARHNLALAEKGVKDSINSVPEFFLKRWVRTVRNLADCTVWSILSLVIFALLLAMVLLFLLAKRKALRKTGFFVGILALLMFVATTAFAISERNAILSHESGIVIESAISVKSSPDKNATELFVLHEGTKVEINSTVDGWYEVSIADGRKGWLECRSVEAI